ncbi:MAG TPA: hypothetical protein VLC98_10745 [Phnomibacter sp.]|nr:hypothetical protein [Phnomibacter sp.]
MIITSGKVKSWIDETQSWEPLSKKLFVIFKRYADYYQKFGRSPKKTLSEIKIRDIYDQIKVIELHLKDIATSLTYLRLKRIDPILKSNKIDKIDYIRFNYENHLIRVVSCPDILSILGNMVFETGLERRKINWDTFSKNKKNVNLKCSEILSSFAKEIDLIRKERQKIIHYGGHKNEIVESINNHTFNKKDIQDNVLSYYFEKKRVEETKRLEKEMKKNYNLCLKYCKDFISSLAGGIETINID